MCESRDVLIVGASGRAAAGSALRADWKPWVVDFFGDEDLSAIAHRHCVIRDYNELPGAISNWPMMPWFFTGALENHPALIQRLSRDRPYWGNSIEVIAEVRSPHRLAQALAEAGCPHLAIWPETKPPPADGRWILKPIRSSGGRDVAIWDPRAAESVDLEATLEPTHYFQERAQGDAVSAVFLTEGNQTVRVGISRLLPANEAAPRFGYGGVIGPVRLAEDLEKQITRQGEIVGHLGLQGIWGMDFIQDGTRVWATEVNPRYTASVELYEYAYGVPLMPAHQRAFERNIKPSDPPKTSRPIPLNSEWAEWLKRNRPTIIVGKAVVYADRDLTVPLWGEWAASGDSVLSDLPALADRPRWGSPVRKGHPLCSILAAAHAEEICLKALNARLASWQRHFRKAGMELPVRYFEPS